MFAVEIREWNKTGLDADRRQESRRADYFAAGTLVVWDVDLRQGSIRVYRATNPLAAVSYGRGETADAEPAVPGWSMPVDDLFPPPR